MNLSAAPSPARPEADSANRWLIFTAGFSVVVATWLAYANTFGVPFLLDDQFTITENPAIRNLGHLGEVLAPQAFSVAGRPFLNLSFALNHAWSGGAVWSYHLVNLIVHSLAGLTLFGFVRRTLLLPRWRGRWAEAALPLAALTASLWALHPLQTEAVTYVSQRAESLMGLLYLLTLYAFLRYTEAGPDGSAIRPFVWAILSGLACLLGMATKEVMVTAPLVVLLYDRAFMEDSFRQALARRRWYYMSLGVAWLWLGFLMTRPGESDQHIGFYSGVSGLTYALAESKVVVDYFKLSFWPHPLVFDYGPDLPLRRVGPAVPFVLLMATALIATGVTWRRSKAAGFLAVIYFVLLSPTSSFVPVTGQPMAENRMYLPLAAVMVGAGLATYAVAGRRAFAWLAIAALLLGGFTFRRNQAYRSDIGLWEDTVAKRPASWRGHNDLGRLLAQVPGRESEAIAQYEEALRLKPDLAEAHFNLAVELAKIPGRQLESIAQYEQALRFKPDWVEAHTNLANELSGRPDRLADAIAHYEQALRLKPDSAEAHYNLANKLAGNPHRLPAAIAHYEQAIHLRPDWAEAHFNLAAVLAIIPDRQSEVIAHYEQALRLKPDWAEAHNNLAIGLSNLPHRLPEAIAHYQQALRLKPNWAQARANLAISYARAGRYDDAIHELELALRLDPANQGFRGILDAVKAVRR